MRALVLCFINEIGEVLGMILIISDVVYYAGIFILYKLICEDDFNYLVLISFIFLLVGLLGASVSNFLKDKEYISLHSKCVEVNVIIKQLLIGISFIGAQIDSVVFKYALIGFSMIGIIVTILICKELYGKHIKLIDFIDTYEKADDCRIKEMNKWLLANGIITCMFMNTTNTKTEYALMCIIILIYMILFIRYNNDRIGGVNCAIAVIFEFIIVLSVLYEWNLITCAIFGYYYLWMIKIRKNM